jgi:beta-lactamase regulating signal transducer with metallopeptidase domain
MNMSAVFLKILNMSITASWLILAVVLARALLKKAPKWIVCLLWALVAIRLVCPFTIESAFSLISSRETIPADLVLSPFPAAHSGIATVTNTVDPIVADSVMPAPVVSGNPLQVALPIVAVIWVAGVVALLLYASVSYLRLKRTVSAAIPLGDHIKICDEIHAPFILGVFKPMIYVPSSLTGKTLDCVIRHERAHIRRRDHWWKPLGFLLLAIYWFNPLCWVAYILLCRDIEMACDEKVIREMDKESMVRYSQALLDCSLPQKRITACPLAFGEMGIKERVKGVLNYKKPTFWIIAVAVVACVIIAVCLLTNQKTPSSPSGELPTARTDVNAVTKTLTAIITDIDNGNMLVKPIEGSAELASSDSFFVPMELLPASPVPSVGDTVVIEYNGGILESYPAQLEKIYAIKIVKNEPRFIEANSHVTWAGWTEDRRIWTESLNPGVFVINSTPHNPIYKFDTRADLEQFKTTFQGVLSFSGRYDEVPSFDEVTAAYNDDFFANHTVLVVYVTTGSGSNRFKLMNVIVNGSTLMMDVVQANNPYYPGTCDMAGWFVLAEVLDSDIEECTFFVSRSLPHDTVISALFDTIMSSPEDSSNPGDYLKAHKKEHEQLLADKAGTLQHIFSEFLHGDQTGLKGQLMRIILDELAPESALKLEAETGQEYFDAWLDQAKKLEKQHGDDGWIEINRPAVYMLLQMIDH